MPNLTANVRNRKYTEQKNVVSSSKTRAHHTFYSIPKIAMEAPREELGYIAPLRTDGRADALGVLDLNPKSPTFSKAIYELVLAHAGDELDHFGWNACSSNLCPLSCHVFSGRRYLIVAGIRSSRIYIVDTKPDPRKPHLIKVIEPNEIMAKTGNSHPHTVHCGSEKIHIWTLGRKGKRGDEGPAGIFILDRETFEILGRWEIDRGPQKLHYNFWWNLPNDYMVSSEWGLLARARRRKKALLKNGPDGVLNAQYP